MKMFGQASPVAGFHYDGDSGVVDGFGEVGQSIGRDLPQTGGAQHQIEIATLVSPAIDAATVNPHFHIRQVLAQQLLQHGAMARLEVQAVSHCWRP